MSISRMPSCSGAGIAYRETSSEPSRSRSAKCWKASGPGTNPARACACAKTRVSISRVTRACAATVSGRASGTRRVAAPTPVWIASMKAAWMIQVAGETRGSIAQDAISVATQAQMASRARPLMPIPPRGRRR